MAGIIQKALNATGLPYYYTAAKNLVAPRWQILSTNVKYAKNNISSLYSNFSWKNTARLVNNTCNLHLQIATKAFIDLNNGILKLFDREDVRQNIYQGPRFFPPQNVFYSNSNIFQTYTFYTDHPQTNNSQPIPEVELKPEQMNKKQLRYELEKLNFIPLDWENPEVLNKAMKGFLLKNHPDKNLDEKEKHDKITRDFNKYFNLYLDFVPKKPNFQPGQN